jgi:broad specificity phosphatase PhoE
MKIYIIRHGETALNAKGVMQGRIDEPLNENGRNLAALTGRGMQGIRFDACISSPLSRALETAELVLRESGNDLPIRIDDRLLEMDFGDIDAKKITEMGEESMSFFMAPFQFPGFPNGESIRGLCERTQPFLKELIAKDDGKTYLISTHGCAMRAMTNYLMESPSDFWLGHAPYNCSLTIVEAEGGAARITDIDRVFYDPKLIADYSQITME